MISLSKIAAAGILALSSGTASAAVIDNGFFTTDTSLGLDYLDVGLISDSYASFLSGTVFDSRTWFLATTTEIASTWSDATGLALTSVDVEDGDNDMGGAATAILISLFDGLLGDVAPSGELVIGNYAVDGYFNYVVDGELAVHSTFDDSHFTSDTTGTQGAWLVSETVAPVPIPAAGFLLIGALGGLAALRRKRS